MPQGWSEAAQLASLQHKEAAMAKDEASSVRKQSTEAKRPKKVTDHIRRLRELNRLFEETGK
jgi:hypothetical protein